LSYAIGATSQSVDVSVYDDDGLPVTGLVAATFPTVKYSKAGANADVSITLADLAAIGTAWASGGLKERGEGAYRLDLPNAVFSTAAKVKIRGEDTDKRLLAPLISVGESADIAAAVADALAEQDITVVYALSGSTLSIYKGTEYSATNGNTVAFNYTTLPDLTSGVAKVRIHVPGQDAVIDKALTITNAGTATQTITLTLTGAETSLLIPRAQYVYAIQYKASGATSYSVATEGALIARSQ
jgi:hypothetical protein